MKPVRKGKGRGGGWVPSTYRGRNVSTGDTFHGSIKVVESLALDDLGADFRADAKVREATFHNEESRSSRQRSRALYTYCNNRD
jgi:hypothetical protein